MAKSAELEKLEAALGKHFRPGKGGEGLDVASEDLRQLPFILMSIEGEESAGKSDLAMRAPKKPWRGKAGLVYFHTDYGYDRVREEVRNDKRVKVIGVPYVTPQIDKKKQWQKYAEEGLVLHKGVWQPFMSIFHDAVKLARSVVLDTGGEFYSFLRICHFGKLHQNPQLNYGPVKAEFLSLVREAKRNRTNLILIHQRKDEYKRKVNAEGGESSVNTGKRVIDAMDKMNYLIDAFVLARYVEPVTKKVRDPETRAMREKQVSAGRFETEILKAKHDLSLNGTVLQDPDFGDIAGMIKPEVDSEAWE